MKKQLLMLPFLLFTLFNFAQTAATPSLDEGTAALKALLLTEEIQNYYPGNQIIFILTTDQTCTQVHCQHFKLKEGTQQVFMGPREELFMRAVKKWLEIDNIYYDDNHKVIVSYHIKN